MTIEFPCAALFGVRAARRGASSALARRTVYPVWKTHGGIVASAVSAQAMGWRRAASQSQNVFGCKLLIVSGMTWQLKAGCLAAMVACRQSKTVSR